VLSDDRVGLVVAEELQRDPLQTPADVEIVVDTVTQAGFEFTEKLAGFDGAIVVDSIKTGKHAVGTVREIGMDDLESTSNLLTSHGIGFKSAVEFGRRVGLKMPGDESIRIFAIEIADNLTISEEMHPRVMKAGKKAVKLIRTIAYGGEFP